MLTHNPQNKLDPRVDSDRSKLEKEHEREREGYGSANTYGNEHERRINEGHHQGAGIGHNNQNQYDRDSGYGTNAAPALPHRKAVNDSSTGNAPLHHATTGGQGAYGNTNRNNNAYDDDSETNNFECAKCGHHNTHLRRNKGVREDQYGNTTNTKPGLMEKLNPKVDSNGDGKAGFMK